ncbi:hypothetical protein QE152_g25483 [Popillia japonica]|uniref:Uncharacterized protein n=1 Tax=Popillia japonica TaxID=7064 RepID=A0AAW1K2P3_POPJA
MYVCISLFKLAIAAESDAWEDEHLDESPIFSLVGNLEIGTGAAQSETPKVEGYNWETVANPMVRRSSMARATAGGSGHAHEALINPNTPTRDGDTDSPRQDDEISTNPIYRLFLGNEKDNNAVGDTQITKKRKINQSNL